MLHDLCIGKTGTMTKGKMNVARYQICDQMQSIEHERDTYPDAFMTKVEIQSELKQYIKECIISNTDVHIETDDKEYTYVPSGQALEVGLIQFLLDNEEDIQHAFLQRNKNAPKLTQLPFDQTLKRKTVIRQVQGNPENVRVYVKGAPEYVIPLCSQTFDQQMQTKDFPENDQLSLLKHCISQEMASTGLKVISYGFKEITMESLN